MSLFAQLLSEAHAVHRAHSMGLVTISEIARQTHLSAATVSQWASEFKLQLIPPPSGNYFNPHCFGSINQKRKN